MDRRVNCAKVENILSDDCEIRQIYILRDRCNRRESYG